MTPTNRDLAIAKAQRARKWRNIRDNTIIGIVGTFAVLGIIALWLLIPAALIASSWAIANGALAIVKGDPEVWDVAWLILGAVFIVSFVAGVFKRKAKS